MGNALDEDFVGNSGKEQLEFYRDFHDLNEAEEFVMLLQANKIFYALDSSEAILDSAIVGTGLFPKAVLKLIPKDFVRVNEIRAERIAALEYKDIAGHYLIKFDNSELQEIFENQEQWTIEDVGLAKIILKNRGIEIDMAAIDELRTSRLSKFAKGESGSLTWMFIYTLFILFGLFFSLIAVIAGIGMSVYYAFGRTTDIDGNSYFLFDDKTRKIGKLMLYGGIVVILFEFALISYVL